MELPLESCLAAAAQAKAEAAGQVGSLLWPLAPAEAADLVSGVASGLGSGAGAGPSPSSWADPKSPHSSGTNLNRTWSEKLSSNWNPKVVQDDKGRGGECGQKQGGQVRRYQDIGFTCRAPLSLTPLVGPRTLKTPALLAPLFSLTLPMLPYPPCLPAAFRQRIQVIRQQFDEELRKVLQGVMLLLAGPEQATSGAAPAAGAGAVRQHPPLTLTHSLLLWICV